MSSDYQVLILPYFKKQLKKLCKKYRHLKQDLVFVLKDFKKDEHQFLGGDLYKVRIKSQDVPRGKSKSFRLIIFILEIGKYIVPVVIYFKGDQGGLGMKEVNRHLEIILGESKKYL